jgi:hypothetical protein
VNHHAIVLKQFQAILFPESKLCNRIFEEISIPKAPKWQTKLELPNSSPQRDLSAPPLGIAPPSVQWQWVSERGFRFVEGELCWRDGGERERNNTVKLFFKGIESYSNKEFY